MSKIYSTSVCFATLYKIARNMSVVMKKLKRPTMKLLYAESFFQYVVDQS
jgi:hypothetical protein